MAKKSKDQPYYLQRAHIRDFRSIRDAVVTFKPGLNIMIGPNGAGKTNFVQALEHGLRKLRPDFRGELELTLAGRVPIEVSYEESMTDSARQSLSLDAVTNLTQQIKLSAGEHIAKGQNVDNAFALLTDYLPSWNGQFFFPRLVVVSHGLPTTYPVVATAEEFLIYPFAVASNIEEQSLFSNALYIGFYSSLVATSDFINKKMLPSHQEVSQSLAKVEQFFLDKLRSELRRFTPLEDVRFAATHQIYTNSTQRHIVVKGVSCEFKINGDWLPFDQLSNGTQRAFYIVAEVVGAFLKYPRTDFPSFNELDRIILLEEPELGIHPDQLFLLTSFLREQSEKHQLIITTHSPQVLDMLNDDELDRIILCELDPKKGTQFRRLTKAKIATAKKFMATEGLYLSDYWRYGSLESTN